MAARPVILGLSGRKGCGKSTLADHFVERGFVSISLADEIKRCAMRWYGFSRQALWGDSALRETKNENGISARFVLERLGTEVGRLIYENTWLDLTMRHARFALQGYIYTQTEGIDVGLGPCGVPPFGVVIPDVRFPNEADAIVAAGGHVMRIVRPSLSRDFPFAHASEVSLSDRDQRFAGNVLLNHEDTIVTFLENGQSLAEHLGYVFNNTPPSRP